MGLSTVQRYCAACDVSIIFAKIRIVLGNIADVDDSKIFIVVRVADSSKWSQKKLFRATVTLKHRHAMRAVTSYVAAIITW